MRSILALACSLACALLFIPLGLTATPHPAAAAGPLTNTVYLPNITKMLGGGDGWQTPFIVQNVGSVATDLTMDFFSFADGSLVKTRSVTGLAPGTSVFHDPNSDPGLGTTGQFSVVVKSFGAPVVSVVNEHQNVTNSARQEALSYLGLTSGSTRVFLPYAAKNAAGWLTTFIIQNLGGAPTNVTAQFKSLDGTQTVSVPRTIAPGRSQFIDPTVEPSLMAGLEYSVNLTADQPIGVVANAHNDAPGTPAPKGFSYNGIPAPSWATSFMPYVQKNVNGTTTRLIIQNAGTTTRSPTVRFRLAAQFATPIIVNGPDLAPGASWSYDPASNGAIADGEYGVTFAGGPWAAVAASLGPTTAAGSSSTALQVTTLYFPNVTRTLGGANGWTTPLAIQTTGADSATLKWYRFSDGALVFSQVLIFNDFGQTFRIDPRQIPDLTDNTQYAVVATSGSGGMAGLVTELNFSGGDGAMNYEGVPPPPGVFGVPSCGPSQAPLGTTFQCVFYGFPPGGTIASISVMRPGGSSTLDTTLFRIGADGTLVVPYATFFASQVGLLTMTATVGTQAQTIQFTVTPQSFPITITESKWGSLAANTRPGIACSAAVVLPNGQLLSDNAGLSPRVTNAQGNVQWIYTKQANTTGTGTHVVECTSGAESPAASASFTAP